MKALSSLSKYLGLYDRWNQIIKKYNLKWSQKDSLEIFNKIISLEENIDTFLSCIKNFTMDEKIPLGYRNLVIFCTLTGLRASEALESIRILKDKDKRDRYYDFNKHIILHYTFANIFIRKTKKAFFSVVNDEIINIALSSYSDSYSSMQSFFHRRRVNLKINYCRKVFATYLRNNGLEPEIIDLLQGRINSTVFVNHYYRPHVDELILSRVRPLLQKLMKEISV